MKMSTQEDNNSYEDCAFVSIHYIICECGETFPSENGLRAHLEKEHPHKKERKEFKCGVCNSIFSQENECIAHYEEAHMDADDVIKQEDCSDGGHEQEQEIKFEETYEYEFQDDQSKQEHEIDEDNQEMSQVDMSPDRMSYVIQDETMQATQTLEKANGKIQYTKPQPSIKMVRDSSTGQLVLVFNRPKRRTPVKKPNKTMSKANIVCEVCGRKYASNAALKYHQRVHSGERPFGCHLCPKAFTMPLFLQIHIRTHTGERPFQCPECPKAFSNKAALMRHERVHTGEKPYTCPLCFKSFTQSNSMKLHVATVHLKQPAPYKSKNRRLKEQKRPQKTTQKSVTTDKIKAFVPKHGSVETKSDCEYEVVISEEVQEDQDDIYEIVYEDA